MKKVFGLGVKDRTPLGFCDKQKSFLGFGHHSTELYKFSYRIQDTNDICRAAFFGNLERINDILKDGKQKVNERDSKERTALHYASFYGNTHMVTFLLEKQCEINACDRDGSTALVKAAQAWSYGCVTVLLQNGADPNIKDKKGNTALHYAIYNENIKISTKLLEYKADTEIKNQEELTPLLLALKENKTEMAEFLINSGANIHAFDDLQRNTLMYAVRCDSEDLIKLLLEKGIDFDFQDAHRWTALRYAVIGRCKVREILVKYDEERFENIRKSSKAHGNSEYKSLASLSSEPGPGASSSTPKEDSNSSNKGGCLPAMKVTSIEVPTDPLRRKGHRVVTGENVTPFILCRLDVIDKISSRSIPCPAFHFVEEQN